MTNPNHSQPAPKYNRGVRAFALGLFAFPFLVIAWFFTMGAIYGTDDRIERVGYFKSDDRERVITISENQPLSRAEVIEIAKRLPHTRGRKTAAVFYRPGVLVPSDSLMMAGSYDAALTEADRQRGITWYAVVQPNETVSVERLN